VPFRLLFESEVFLHPGGEPLVIAPFDVLDLVRDIFFCAFVNIVSDLGGVVQPDSLASVDLTFSGVTAARLAVREFCVVLGCAGGRYDTNLLLLRFDVGFHLLSVVSH